MSQYPFPPPLLPGPAGTEYPDVRQYSNQQAIVPRGQLPPNLRLCTVRPHYEPMEGFRYPDVRFHPEHDPEQGVNPYTPRDPQLEAEVAEVLACKNHRLPGPFDRPFQLEIQLAGFRPWTVVIQSLRGEPDVVDVFTICMQVCLVVWDWLMALKKRPNLDAWLRAPKRELNAFEQNLVSSLPKLNEMWSRVRVTGVRHIRPDTWAILFDIFLY